MILYLEAEAENISANLKTKPFLATNLGRLAPEIRGLIFTNLLAIPPPYGGRDFRANPAPMVGQSPVSLTTFVDLKASCLAVLWTCRQVYLEAFPVFYASKSYYLANSQHLATFCEFGQHVQVGPRLFRADTITSLCLKDLVVTKPKWTPRQVDDLMARSSTFDRARLAAGQISTLDSKLMLADLGGMNSLRKICLCMRVGQELLYLRFLFGIRGLRRGVIHFVDNVHWTFHSQSVSGDDWSLQYTAFPTGFYRKGKNFEVLDLQDVRIQREVLDIDSRASGLVEDDERWVEVDIGSRNYEESLPRPQPVPVVVPARVFENQQTVLDGEIIGSATDGGSDPEFETLEGPPDEGTNGTELANESAWSFDQLLGQPDGEENGTPVDNEQDQESGDLQQQPNENHDGSRSENEPHRKSGFLQGREDGRDHNVPAESNMQTVLDPGGPVTENRAFISIGTVQNEETDNLGAPLHIEASNNSTASEPDPATEDARKLREGRLTDCRGETDHSRIPETTPERSNGDHLDYRPTETIQAATQLVSRLPSIEYRDVQIQTEPRESERRNAETQTELRERAKRVQAKRVQKESQIATAPTLKDLESDQGIVEQPKGRGRKRVPVQLETEAFKITMKSLSHTEASPIPQRSLQKSSTSPLSQKPEMLVRTTRNKATLQTARKSLPISHTTLYAHGLIRVAAFMLALYLLYLLFYAGLENMLGQILALLLFVLLFFLALGSDNELKAESSLEGVEGWTWK